MEGGHIVIVTVLVENISKREDYLHEHGLSLFIETKGQKILFDFGHTDKFITNGEKMGVPFQDIDFAVLSHGHYDHGDGIPYFFEKNKTAPVYLQMNALIPYFSSKAERAVVFEDMSYIGLNPILRKEPYYHRFHFIDSMKKLNDGVTIYSGFEQRRLVPSINSSLYMMKEDGFVRDEFQHECCLLIEENGKYYLFAGCAHNGIVNLVEQVEQFAGITIDVVFSGFHLHTSKKGNQVAKEEVLSLANTLKEMKTIFYTGHCTGVEEYKQMKEVLGEQLFSMSTGDTFTFT